MNFSSSCTPRVFFGRIGTFMPVSENQVLVNVGFADGTFRACWAKTDFAKNLYQHYVKGEMMLLTFRIIDASTWELVASQGLYTTQSGISVQGATFGQGAPSLTGDAVTTETA